MCILNYLFTLRTVHLWGLLNHFVTYLEVVLYWEVLYADPILNLCNKVIRLV